MILKSTSVAAIFGAAMLAASAASATTIYDNKADWTAAAGGPIFNTTSDANAEGTPITDILLADGSTITTSDLVYVNTIGISWATWSGGYTGTVYQPVFGNEISISLPGFSAFGLEVEPDVQSAFDVTLTLSDGSTITDSVDGNGGAQFFGWVADNIDMVTISTTDSGFAFGNIYSVRAVGTPEPFTLALFGAGLAGLGALRRRKA
jgi:hypothetical protein